MTAAAAFPRVRSALDLFDGLGRGVAEIPGDPVKALLGRSGDGPDDGTLGIVDGQQDGIRR